MFIIRELGKGGGEQQLLHLVREIDRRLFDPIVVSVIGKREDRASYVPYVYNQFLKVAPVHFLGRRGPVDPAALARLAVLYRRYRPDVICMWSFAAGLYGRLAAFLNGWGPRCIVGYRNVDFCVGKSDRIRLVVENILNRGTRYFTANSSDLAARLRNLGLRLPDIVVIPNIITLDLIDQVYDSTRRRESEGGPQGRTVTMAMLARVERPKDHWTLLDAYAGLLVEGHPANLVLIGGGSDEALLRKKVEKRGLPGVAITGWLPRPEALKRLAAADIAVFASRGGEGLPNAVIESMALGLPVVATDVEGVRSLISPGESGYIVPPAQPAALRDALRVLIEDEQLRQKMGEAAYTRIRSILPKPRQVAERYERLFYQVLSNITVEASE